MTKKIRKLVLGCVFAALILVMTVPVASAHSHIETGNDGCVDLPDSYHGDETRGHAGFGIGVAKGGTINPNFPPAEGFFPGDLDSYPTQSADSAIEGGGCH